MKKLLLTLGTAASIAAPLATVVACGDEETPTTPGIDGDNGTENTNWLQVGGTDFLPAEDGVYLMADYYTGTLYDAGAEYAGEILEINANDWASDAPQVLHMGKDDSVVVVYDDDDADGYGINNFEDTFGFYDSNFYQGQKLAEYNATTYNNKVYFDNAWGATYGLISTFKDGNLNKYVGASYNDGVTTETSLQALKGTISDADYAALLDGLYFVEEADGSYSDAAEYDPNGAHQYLRGQAVNPVPTPLFEYEKIADNAIKITYIQENDAFKQDYASFGFISEHATEADTYTLDKKGEIYIGEDTWGKNALPENLQGLRTTA